MRDRPVEIGHQPAEVGDFLAVDQDQRVAELGGQRRLVGDEIARDIAAVEPHAADRLELVLDRLAGLDDNFAMFAGRRHGIGDQRAEVGIAVGGDGRDLGDLLGLVNRHGRGADMRDHGVDGDIDTAPHADRPELGGHRTDAAAQDGIGQHRCRGRAVAGRRTGFHRHFAQQARAHIGEGIGKFDALGDGRAVPGHLRAVEVGVEQNVAPARAQRHLDRVGHCVGAAHHLCPRLAAEFDLRVAHANRLRPVPALAGAASGCSRNDYANLATP